MFLVQMLIKDLNDLKDQQLLNWVHINSNYTTCMDHVTKVSPTPLCTVIINHPNIKMTSKECLTLEPCEFAEQKTRLLNEVDN